MTKWKRAWKDNNVHIKRGGARPPHPKVDSRRSSSAPCYIAELLTYLRRGVHCKYKIPMNRRAKCMTLGSVSSSPRPHPPREP